MICVYEDDHLKWLSPLVELRPVFDLRCGRFTLLEKLRQHYPRERFALWVRDELAELTSERFPGIAVNKPLKTGGLLLSARVVLDEPVKMSGPEAVLLAGDEPVGFRLERGLAAGLDSLRGLSATLAEEPIRARVVHYPWDIVEMNSAELLKETTGRDRHPPIADGRPGRMEGALVGPRSALRVESGARVWPGAVVSTGTGPVLISRGAMVRPGSFVEGPCYVGPGTVIDGALVRPGCSFGPECRIGGEVEATVFQGYSNKHHDGFVGHSFVGEWVNLGALTTTSDLKNTYETVRVFYRGIGNRSAERAASIDTGLTKVGCFFGDHVKTAIGSLFNSGCRVGAFANWFEPGLARKELAPFSWGKHGCWSCDAAVANARVVMARRGVQMSAAYERAVRDLYERTAVGEAG